LNIDAGKGSSAYSGASRWPKH